MGILFKTNDIEIRDDRLFFILGPCVIENERLTLQIAQEVKKLAQEIEIPVIFKASFDKANRSSLESYRGPGIKKGLQILAKVKDSLNLPVLSDIHEVWQAKPAAEVLSVIQIPAFLSRQTDLLLAAGETGLPINVKKGQHMSPEDMSLVVEKIQSTGNKKIFLTERGNFFGYRNLVVDFRNIPIMKKTGYPVIIDATHSLQRPSAAKGISGGDPEYIPIMALSGVVSGANGVFLEIHPEPARALSDGKNLLDLKFLKNLLIKIKTIYNIL
ncbi:MAG: 3-deoxy-8-phosphooctulonate synthase [Candidatus Aminicenantes bacterium]|nr:3-deoxy-8-phosphooctulonate synthase [Candidatus Aminicenantes bacterium]